MLMNPRLPGWGFRDEAARMRRRAFERWQDLIWRKAKTGFPCDGSAPQGCDRVK